MSNSKGNAMKTKAKEEDEDEQMGEAEKTQPSGVGVACAGDGDTSEDDSEESFYSVSEDSSGAEGAKVASAGEGAGEGAGDVDGDGAEEDKDDVGAGDKPKRKNSILRAGSAVASTLSTGWTSVKEIARKGSRSSVRASTDGELPIERIQDLANTLKQSEYVTLDKDDIEELKKHQVFLGINELVVHKSARSGVKHHKNIQAKLLEGDDFKFCPGRVKKLLDQMRKKDGKIIGEPNVGGKYFLVTDNWIVRDFIMHLIGAYFVSLGATYWFVDIRDTKDDTRVNSASINVEVPYGGFKPKVEAAAKDSKDASSASESSSSVTHAEPVIDIASIEELNKMQHVYSEVLSTEMAAFIAELNERISDIASYSTRHALETITAENYRYRPFVQKSHNVSVSGARDKEGSLQAGAVGGSMATGRSNATTLQIKVRADWGELFKIDFNETIFTTEAGIKLINCIKAGDVRTPRDMLFIGEPEVGKSSTAATLSETVMCIANNREDQLGQVLHGAQGIIIRDLPDNEGDQTMGTEEDELEEDSRVYKALNVDPFALFSWSGNQYYSQVDTETRGKLPTGKTVVAVGSFREFFGGYGELLSYEEAVPRFLGGLNLRSKKEGGTTLEDVDAVCLTKPDSLVEDDAEISALSTYREKVIARLTRISRSRDLQKVMREKAREVEGLLNGDGEAGGSATAPGSATKRIKVYPVTVILKHGDTLPMAGRDEYTELTKTLLVPLLRLMFPLAVDESAEKETEEGFFHRFLDLLNSG